MLLARSPSPRGRGHRTRLLHRVSGTAARKPGVLTQRAPSEEEQKDIAYGRTLARGLAAFDLGQTSSSQPGLVASKPWRARRHHRTRRLADAPHKPGLTLSRALTVVKVAKPAQDMRFDVPVIGLATIEVMTRAGATCSRRG